MASASPPPSGYAERGSLRRRGVSLALAIAINVLMVAMLLRLASFTPEPPADKPKTFALLPDPGVQAERVAAKAPAKGAAKQAPARPAEPARAEQAPPPAPETPPPLNMVVMSRQAFAAADISRLPLARPADIGGGAPAESGGGSSASADEGVGRGPNGERLYNAEWYRHPSRAELATYLPADRPRTGWGLIACRTVSGYRVEDCSELGESPGSGLARALRQAAWQFRVLPPRIGGRAMVGAWVRIRMDFTVEAVN